MKKITLPVFVFTIFISSTVHAQKARIGFSAGATLAQAKTAVDNQKDKSDLHLGFALGVVADVSLGEQFSFQPALNILQKGGKDNQTMNGVIYKSAITLNYLELPLNFVYHDKGKKGHFIAGIGPSLAYALSGKAKISSGDQTESVKLKIGNGTDDDLKPFEFGGNVLAGYESSNGIFVTVNYNFGLSNVSTDSQSTLKNSYFGLRIGYLLHH
jgi:Outer membrane protein beta-barrel domain